MKKKSRLIIIGLDGVPFDLLKSLSDKGVMPNVKECISQGIFKRMRSSIPEISSVAWSSIITGTNPGQHGIFGFVDFYPLSYKLDFLNYYDLRSSPFWETTNRKSVIINIPSTYPVRPMNGIHISGFVSIDLEKAVYPKVLIKELKKIDYRIDVDSNLAHKSLDLFLGDMDKALKGRISAYKYFWNSSDWDIFMFVFTETDRLMHFMWDAYEDELHKHHGDFMRYFEQIDRAIGEINSSIDKDDLFILLSDHGFERLGKDIFINNVLMKEGFLRFKGAAEENHCLEDIGDGVKAFALDPSRIYINLKGKYPEGGVDLRDRDKVINDLIVLFSSLEVDGRLAIKDVHRKEDIYEGQFLDQAPDLVLIGNEGFNLRANLNVREAVNRTIFTGKHKYDNAFFLINSRIDSNTIPENLSVYDILKIIKEYTPYL